MIDTQAFSRTVASRGADVGVAGDEDALLGVDVVPAVTAGAGATRLVTLTNNANAELSVSISLADPSQGTLSPSTVDLAPGERASVDVSVSSNSPTGVGALTFTIEATNGDSLSITQTRHVDVARGIVLRRLVRDRSNFNNAAYEVYYRVEGVADFDRLEVEFVNTDRSRSPRTVSGSDPEGAIAFQRGGASGDDFELVFRVYDGDDDVALERTVTDVADGEDPPGNDDLSTPTSPTLEAFTVTDDSRGNRAAFTVEYEVADTAEFDRVDVTFRNVDSDEPWAWQRESSTDAPTGTVTYEKGGAGNDDYDITVDVVDGDGVIVDSGTVTDEADGVGPVSYP